MSSRDFSASDRSGVPAASRHWAGHARPVGAPPVTTHGPQAGSEPINWWLIALALGYALLSYVWLTPSIWVRLLLASFLIVRMRADIIIPYFISCLQLRLNFREGLSDVIDIGTPDITAGQTGFESYAFAIPPLLISVRTAIAVVDKRIDRSHFPWSLYLVWALGGILVVVGAFTILGSSPGWTGAMRMYSIVGGVFYGMLMPRMTSKQVDRLAAGLGCVCLAYFTTLLTVSFGGKLTFVIAPMGAAWAASQLLSRKRFVLASILLAVTGYVCLFKGTFMMLGTWVWALMATCIGQFTSLNRRHRNGPFAICVVATAVFCAVLFYYGVTRKITENQKFDTSLLGRIEYKLYADRGPIWYGCVTSLMEEPSLLPTPERAFYIEWLGFDRLWPFGPHNLVLELLNQLGMVAGAIAIAVMAYAVWGCVGAVGRDASSGVRSLATAAICSILVGGLTFPYSVGDRLGENIVFTAGLAIANSWGWYGSPPQAREVVRG